MLFVVGLGMLREGLADYKRAKEDKKANKTTTKKIGANGQVIEVPSMHLKVGDIIELEDDSFIPADCVVLHTTKNSNGSCYIQTASLDGERNLKPRLALKEVMDNWEQIKKGTKKLRIDYQAPEMDLHRFDGNLFFDSQEK